MKHKETFIAIIFMIVFILFAFGCSSKKELVKKEELKEVVDKGNHLAKDEVVIDYKVTQQKECEQLITIDITEYFPITDTIRNVQMVKSVTKKVIGKKKVENGLSSSKVHQVNTDSTVIEHNEISSSQELKKSEKQNSNVKLWIWIIILMLVLIILLRFILIKEK